MKEMIRTREREHEQMLQRYQNVKKELENQQTLDRIKFDKIFGKQMQASQTVGSRQKEAATQGMGSTQSGFSGKKKKGSPGSKRRS